MLLLLSMYEHTLSFVNRFSGCCCGGRRRRSLAAAQARGALGNANLVPRAEQVGSRSARNCGQCNCQDCKAMAGPVAAPGASAARSPVPTTQCTAGQCRQCRQCTPEEEKACLAMMAASRKASPAVAPKDAGLHLYRKFKRAIAVEKTSAAGCSSGAAGNAQCKC
ncbi:hypothetical protein M3Y98_00411500 [Aphelenchoides besseyi]|nr:hypothetical protein M3Y98_00411500 [Aphelenchoides besseyi]KAI6202045.1 hypothetical protein M3Y96_00906600 [Aphelenchoides besseyi]